jgi:predicted MFS family arabinose efflux permease
VRIQNPYVILGLLSGLNLVNYIDRQLVPAVGPKLQAELGLSDAQFGLVSTAFMLGYCLTSPFFGVLGDRRPRRTLIALGVAIWSVATAASGIARSFATLIAARVVVGVGEASYATLAPTIIDDLAKPEVKNRWLGIFYVAIPVGSAIGYLLGGNLEHAFGWRSVFFIVGWPGILLAALVLLVSEPARAPRERADTSAAMFSKLAKIPVYRDAVIGYVAQTFAVGGFGVWAPTYLYRHYGMELKTANLWFGVILVVTGLLATFVGAQLGDRLRGADRARVNLRLCAVTTLIGAPFAALCFLTSSPVVFFIGIGVAEFAIFLSTSPINVVILQSVPEELRASAMAMSIFAIHLLGDMISPTLIGLISGASSLQTAMLVLPIALAIAAFSWWRGSIPRRVIGATP